MDSLGILGNKHIHPTLERLPVAVPANRILIVEDNLTNLSLLAAMLRGAQLTVAIAVTGAEALKQIEAHPPALILLDVKLPDTNGFDLCQILKDNPVTQDIPIIFMTALTEVSDKVKGLSMGAVDYITKPFHPAEVLARVRIHLEMRLLTCRVLEQAAQLEEANHELQRLARLDALTQVANRRWFDEYLDREWRRLSREHKPLSLIFCDVDCFKTFNDHYGHLRGDTCLKKLANVLERTAKRPADLVARYGGEEFILILPDTEATGALRVAHAIQESLCQLQIPHEQSSVTPFVTVSLGITCQIPTLETSSDDLVATADRALYLAKQKGRNTYHILPPEAVSESLSSEARETSLTRSEQIIQR